MLKDHRFMVSVAPAAHGPRPCCAASSLTVHLRPLDSPRRDCIHAGGTVTVYLDRDILFKWQRVIDAKPVCSIVRIAKVSGENHSIVLSCVHPGLDHFLAYDESIDPSGSPPNGFARLDLSVRG